MIDCLFYFTGFIVWCLLATVILLLAGIAVHTYWLRELKPSLEYLCFAVTGRPYWSEGKSCYEYWRVVSRSHPRKNGKFFFRCAYRRLVYEARKERRKNITH